MRLPLLDEKNPTSIDIEHFKTMVDAFIEGGGTYFDTAFVYHNGTSETALREALVKRYPRDAYTVATKCLAWAAPDVATAQSNLQTSLDDILTEHPDMDFVQLQVNYLDWEDPVVQSRRCMEVAQKHGVPVIVMEPARGGRLIDLPARVSDVFKKAAPDRSIASWAYRFCYNLPNVITVLSGMSSIEHVRENVDDYRSFGSKPFSPEEQLAFDEAVTALHAVDTIACTNCRYCVKDCPQEIAIPNILGLLNLEAYTENREFAKGQYAWQAKAPASECIECGACEDMCPQKIDIINQLKRAAEHFE